MGGLPASTTIAAFIPCSYRSYVYHAHIICYAVKGRCAMNKELRQLHHTLVDLVGLMNRPQRDSALLQEAGVALDRALFPLLIVIEHKAPIGVVELSELVGRDYTTVSRQVSKLDLLGLINRRRSKTDSRICELSVTSKAKVMTGAIDAA